MNLTLSYPAWYIILCLVLGAALSFILYYRDWQFRQLGAPFKKWIWTLAIIRFLAISFIAFLLLSPLIRTLSTRVEKPIVVLAQDNSQSVLLNQSSQDSSLYKQNITGLIKALSKDYEVKAYSFGSSLNEGLKFSFSDKSTNISSALSEISNLYTDQNLGAIILASDGIYNEGSNPVYLKNELNVPIYTVGMGDTTFKRDLQLSNILYNRTVFLGDYFPLKVEWRAQFCANEKTSLSVANISGNAVQTVEEKSISIENNDFSGSNEFLIKAGTPGIVHYRLALSQVSNEASVVNNSRDLFIEVIEKKEKILILANSPHPDIAAFKQAIESNKNYEAAIAFAPDFPDKIDEYNLIVLHQLPTADNNLQSVISNIKSKKKSILFILGSQSNISLVNGSQTMVNIRANNNSTTDAFPLLSSEFILFNLPDNVIKALPSWPPLASPFGEYKLSPSATALLTQKIGAVTTKYPLIFFQQDLNGRSGMVAGEGLWRWRMADFQETQNHEAFNALVSSIVQYLSVKGDDRQFRVRLEKEQLMGGSHLFSENESVVFNAELLNESNELINSPDVTIIVKDDQGKDYPFIFSKTNNAYTLNAGFFQVGNYKYSAKVNFNKKDFAASGAFTVSPTQLELEATRADHQLLYSLSNNSGGELFYPLELNELAEAIYKKQNIKPVLYSSTRTEPLINLRWLFIPILLLLVLEWGIRKFNGGY